MTVWLLALINLEMFAQEDLPPPEKMLLESNAPPPALLKPRTYRTT